jgi:hypothetical protein
MRDGGRRVRLEEGLMNKFAVLRRGIVVTVLLVAVLQVLSLGPVRAAGNLDTLRRQILAEFGPALAPEAVANHGEIFARHEAQFVEFAAEHMARDGAKWQNANYYDRAKIFYVYFARTGNEKYLKWANAIALDYRENFIEANKYGPSAHWSQMSGLYLHFLATGDPASRVAIVKVGELFSLPYYLKNLGDITAETDNRIQARTILALLYAYRVEKMEDGAPQKARAKIWAQRLREALTRIIASQGSDGAYRFARVQCGHNKPYMVGLLNDALIEYYDLFDKDPRIPRLIDAAVRYLWEKDWDEASQSFVYLDGACGEDGPTPAPDLNGLIVGAFGFLFRLTGDETYRTRGDAVFAGGVNGAWLAGPKVFNQSYYSAYRYPAYRAVGAK